ncbi:uncharacterized protein [Panulirus ornatus]|uniref:uncharacterized protein isoform X2 n=1 Tax=Panulirus ornatus TaxID=150431 RepID=UPI003A88D0D0
MEEAVRCSVCSEVYQTGPRDPLVLPCGHAFCRSCLTNVYITGNFICPSCRRDLNHLDVQDLPRCFPLLSLSASYSEFQPEQCSLHKDEQSYWCQDCQETMCSVCLYEEHPQGHLVQCAKVFLKEKRDSLSDEISHLNDMIRSVGSDIEISFQKFVQKMKLFCQLEKSVTALSTDVLNASTVHCILTCEEKLKNMQLDQERFFFDIPDVAGGDGESTAVVSAAAAGGGGGRRQDGGTYSRQQTPPTTAAASGAADDTVEASRARLGYQDGRLLLHSLSQPLDSRLFIKLPSEVFLELSVAGRCLGRVYIKLWGHLRRAHQFLALCLGTLGPSYVGASFSHVAYMKKARESLCCKEYRSSDGKSCTRELMNDLEWGGEFARTPQEGLVIPLSKNIDEHGFGICTRGQLEGRFHCPFGEVTSGLKFVRAAIRHDPVTEVTITDCGLVIPDLTE